MAAYCDYQDVAARAGRFASVFEVAGRHPNQADVELFIVNAAAEIDSHLRAAGFDPATLAANTVSALKDLNAWGALALALPGADLGAEGDTLLAKAMAAWQDGLARLSSGTFGALAALAAAGGPSAGSFWQAEPGYGTPQSLQAEHMADNGANQTPRFHRGQSL